MFYTGAIGTHGRLYRTGEPRGYFTEAATFTEIHIKESKSSNNLIVYTSTSSSTCNTNTIKYRHSRYPIPKFEHDSSISELVEEGGSQGDGQALKLSTTAQFLGLLRKVVAREIDKPRN